MPRTRGRLRWQLLLPLLIFEIVSLLIIGLTMFFIYQEQFQGTLDSQRETAARAAKDVAAYLSSLQTDLLNAGLNEDLMRRTPEQQREALGRLQARQGAYVTLVIVDRAGVEKLRVALRSDAPMLPSKWDQHEALSRVLTGDIYSGAVEFHAGLPYMLMAVPVRDPQLRNVGMLVAQVDLGSLWDVVATAGSGQAGYVYVIDQAGQLVAAREMGLVMRQPDVTGLSGVRAALNDQQPAGTYSGLNDVDVIGGMSWIANLDWRVIAELPVSEAFAYLGSLLPLLGFQVLVGIALAVGVWLYVSGRVVNPILEITRGAQFIGDGNLNYRLEVTTGAELADLARVFNATTAQLQELVGSLEQRVAERTHELERRATQLEAASQVARDAATILDPGELLQRTVELIRERFGYYHASIFLLDDRQEYAVLRAATGEVGRQLIAQDFKLEVGEVGMVGYAAASGRPRIARDVHEDRFHFDNPLLPDTRSEMTLPLQIRGQVLGVLDVQSAQVGAFADEDVAMLQTLADQVAVALDKARLFAESQEALEATRRAYAALSREAWAERTRAQPDLGYRRDKDGISPAGIAWRPQMEVALQTGETTLGQGDDATTLTIPVKVLGEVIGVLDARKPDDAGTWTAEEVTLLETLTDQLGATLVSAQLFEDTQRRAHDEQQLRTITAQVRDAPDLDAILQTTVQEMARALGVERVFVQLGTPPLLEPQAEE